jgi:hypothetical protein
MNQTINIVKKENFNQVCVWPGTVVGKDQIKKFEEFMLEQFKTRIQYLEEIETTPDLDDNGKPIKETGNRNDVFFSVHNEDIGKFAIPRLSYGIRWIEDTLSDCNYHQDIYPSRVFEYKTW